MTIFALDLGTSTGWALTDGVTVESGVQTFDVKRGESPGMRYVRFNAWLSDTAIIPDLIVYEQTHQRGGAATEVAAGLATRVQEYCAREKCEHTAVHTATLKKWATGSGRGGKTAMIAAACNLGSRGPVFQRAADDFMKRYNDWCDKVKPNTAQVEKSPFADEADALCLLAYAQEELVGEVPGCRVKMEEANSV